MALQNSSGDVHMAAASRSLQKDANDFADLSCLQLHRAHVKILTVVSDARM